MKVEELTLEITAKAEEKYTNCIFAIVRDNTIQEIKKRLFCFNILKNKVDCYGVETGIIDCDLSTDFLDVSTHDYDLVEVFDIADVKVGV